MRILQAILGFGAVVAIGAWVDVGVPAHAQLGTGGASAAADVGPPDRGAAESADAPRATGSCIANRVSYRTQTNSISTLSTAFVTMPNTHFPVTHAAGCLVVDFSGEMHASFSTGRIIIRAFIGGIGAAQPPDVLIGPSAVPGNFETRSMRFVFPNVPAGTHTVRIDWRTDNMTSTISTRNRTLTVLHR